MLSFVLAFLHFVGCEKMFSITLLYRLPLINGQKSYALIAKKIHIVPRIAGPMPPCDEDAAEDERLEDCCSTGVFVGGEEVGDESRISGEIS